MDLLWPTPKAAGPSATLLVGCNGRRRHRPAPSLNWYGRPTPQATPNASCLVRLLRADSVNLDKRLSRFTEHFGLRRPLWCKHPVPGGVVTYINGKRQAFKTAGIASAAAIDAASAAALAGACVLAVAAGLAAGVAHQAASQIRASI